MKPHSIHPRFHHVLCPHPAGLHRMAYAEWGSPQAPHVLLCVHGLTRTGRDFDTLARTLLADPGLHDSWRIVCPDMAGRGQSGRLAAANYHLGQYVSDVMVLIARLGVFDQLVWLGTSMGGLMGMTLAAQPDQPITRLILNDVGPFVPAQALQRLATYVGEPRSFADRREGELHLRQILAPFGPMNEEQWCQTLSDSLIEGDDGRWHANYDPAIGEAFRAALAVLMAQAGGGSSGEPPGMDFWPLYDRIVCPTWAIRGASSDLLTADVHADMARRGPKARLEVCPEVGHAPMFVRPDQSRLILEFLRTVKA